jgi:hypothetical protein
VLQEANALNPLIQFQMFKFRGLKMYNTVDTEHGPVVVGNERILWHGALASWLRSAGIEQESVRYYRLFPSHPKFEPLFELERRVSGKWLAPVYTHYNFVGRKAA